MRAVDLLDDHQRRVRCQLEARLLRALHHRVQADQGEPPNLGAPALVLDRVTVASDDPFGTSLHDISLDVRAGEIVGIAGVDGNGQAQLVEAVEKQGEAVGGGGERRTLRIAQQREAREVLRLHRRRVDRRKNERGAGLELDAFVAIAAAQGKRRMLWREPGAQEWTQLAEFEV